MLNFDFECTLLLTMSSDITLSSIETCPPWESLSNERRKPPKNLSQHRIGPIPREDAKKSADEAPAIGTLDSDMEDFEADDEPHMNKTAQKFLGVGQDVNNQRSSIAGSRALVIYFAKMAKMRGPKKEKVDFHFLETILRGRADINAADKHGQTALHEVARNWHPDVALFFIQRGANLNKCDNYGRSPLHLAAAVNYHEMVEFLIHNGGKIHFSTDLLSSSK